VHGPKAGGKAASQVAALGRNSRPARRSGLPAPKAIRWLSKRTRRWNLIPEAPLRT